MTNIFYSGDWHGEFGSAKREIERFKIGNENDLTYLIQVGDFGIGFYPATDSQTLIDLNEFFKSKNILTLAIRGNHDNPEFFNGNHIYSNLQLLKDYTTMKIGDYNHLFVGGAVSVDRVYLLGKMQENANSGIKIPLFWFDEIFKFEEDKVKDLKDIDIVVTHTSPKWCYPDNSRGFGSFVEGYAYYDKSLLSDLTKEREDVTKMFNILNKNNKIKYHFYGHFHRSDIRSNGYTQHQLLGVNEFHMIESGLF